MRSAPPVQMTCGGDARWWLLGFGLSALAAGVGVGWAARLAGADPLAAWMLAAAAAAGSAFATRPSTNGARTARLVWDGRSWSLDGAGVTPVVRIDLGGWMLLRMDGDASALSRWWPLDLPRCGAPVHLARAALHARNGQHAPAAAPGQAFRHG